MNIFELVLIGTELLLGIYLHVRKIKRVKNEKEITWELEFYHSITCITFLTVSTILDVLDYKCHDIEDVAVIAILYSIVRWIRIFSLRIILFHSFALAMYKYYVIIHSGRLSSEDKSIEKRWLILLVILPLVWTFVFLLGNLGTLKSQSLIAMCNSTEWNLCPCNFNDNNYYEQNGHFFIFNKSFKMK